MRIASANSARNSPSAGTGAGGAVLGLDKQVDMSILIIAKNVSKASELSLLITTRGYHPKDAARHNPWSTRLGCLSSPGIYRTIHNGRRLCLD